MPDIYTIKAKSKSWSTSWFFDDEAEASSFWNKLKTAGQFPDTDALASSAEYYREDNLLEKWDAT